jgi:hypothetical protein
MAQCHHKSRVACAFIHSIHQARTRGESAHHLRLPAQPREGRRGENSKEEEKQESQKLKRNIPRPPPHATGVRDGGWESASAMLNTVRASGHIGHTQGVCVSYWSDFTRLKNDAGDIRADTGLGATWRTVSTRTTLPTLLPPPPPLLSPMLPLRFSLSPPRSPTLLLLLVW